MAEDAPEQIIETCHACGQLLDVSDLPAFAEIDCPNCGTAQRVRKLFNHFELLELLGEGGMGSVYKARDVNLQREVALKILKRGSGGGQSDYRKLAEEARITASINHPHVVRVFSSGEAQGQFYIAMELVPKGSLDDLMGLQGRVGEMQALNVGIQVAQGLQAANDKGLLHRDVKPGNILFADAATAKIVDFGLAVLLDEQAQEQGEIWGTPYYIAPEKLDNRPEDFRSDIYSLGGTLFHAIAGRPPFEATTASMVALKHIKSQAVSLQAFAPDVSSETAYVINRTLNKEPDERYGSYDELIGHLVYAKQKLHERTQAPVTKKDRGIVESEDSKRVMGIVWGLTLLALIGAGVFVFLNRDQIPGLDGSSAPATLSARDVNRLMEESRIAFVEGRFGEAIEGFGMVADSTTAQPTRNWALANQALAMVIDGDPVEASDIFGRMNQAGLYSTDPRDRGLANFFIELGRLMAGPQKIPPGTIRVYSPNNYEAFAMLAYGLKDWSMGAIEEGGQMLEAFDNSEPAEPHGWIADYKSMVQPYLLDLRTYQMLKRKVERATPGSAAEIHQEIEAARAEARTGMQIDGALAVLAMKLEEKLTSQP